MTPLRLVLSSPTWIWPTAGSAQSSSPAIPQNASRILRRTAYTSSLQHLDLGALVQLFIEAGAQVVGLLLLQLFLQRGFDIVKFRFASRDVLDQPNDGVGLLHLDNVADLPRLHGCQRLHHGGGQLIYL